MNPRRLILASASPRRRQLLIEAGFAVEVVPSPLAEPDHFPPGCTPAARAEASSYYKAAAVAETVKDGLVLAGDTIVSLEGVIYGKPADSRDARRILQALAGTTHEVITGVTVLDAATRRRRMGHARTRVTMWGMTDPELDAYLAGGAWEGKAGAYGIQDQGDAFVICTEGSFSNVVGLPIELVAEMIRDWPTSD